MVCCCMKDEILEKVKAWSAQEANIRLALLAGSRAGGKRRVDELSDYDITLFVQNIPELLLREEEWQRSFGRVMIRLNEKATIADEEYPARLILYEDGIKIDFGIFGLEAFQGITVRGQLPGWIQSGYEILVDKDGMAKALEALSRKAPEIKPPTEEEYQAVANEFFWELTYIARNLKREELWLAKYSEWVLREEMLLKMLEWYAKARNGWGYDTQYKGKGIRKWLDAETCRQLERTYSGAGMAENWRGLNALLVLFRKTAGAVGVQLGFNYPEELDRKITEYIGRIRNPTA